jgi:hypothetical protein
LIFRHLPVVFSLIGGDPDNFEFPRYDFDISYLRVYADGKPLDTSRNHFRYPDATFSPRLSYGSIAGYNAGGRQIGPFTYVKGLYERATGPARSRCRRAGSRRRRP